MGSAPPSVPEAARDRLRAAIARHEQEDIAGALEEAIEPVVGPEGAVQGGLATAAVVVNAIPKAVAHAAGLVTMLDLPPLTAKGGAQ